MIERFELLDRLGTAGDAAGAPHLATGRSGAGFEEPLEIVDICLPNAH